MDLPIDDPEPKPVPPDQRGFPVPVLPEGPAFRLRARPPAPPPPDHLLNAPITTGERFRAITRRKLPLPLNVTLGSVHASPFLSKHYYMPDDTKIDFNNPDVVAHFKRMYSRMRQLMIILSHQGNVSVDIEHPREGVVSKRKSTKTSNDHRTPTRKKKGKHGTHDRHPKHLQQTAPVSAPTPSEIGLIKAAPLWQDITLDSREYCTIVVLTVVIYYIMFLHCCHKFIMFSTPTRKKKGKHGTQTATLNVCANRQHLSVLPPPLRLVL